MNNQEICPTCHSDEKDMPHIGHINNGTWKYCNVCGDALCPDSWHNLPVPMRNIMQDEIEGYKLAREQRQGLTTEENKLLDDLQEWHLMGIKLNLTDAQLALSESIRQKMNINRYG